MTDRPNPRKAALGSASVSASAEVLLADLSAEIADAEAR